MKRLTGLGAGLYVLALALPAIVFEGPLLGGDRPETMFGLQCLLAGLIVFPAWLANPLLLLSWFSTTIADRRMWLHRVAVWCAVLATIAAIAAPFVLAAMKIRFGYVHAGYFVWLASCVLTTIGAYARMLDAEEAKRAAAEGRLDEADEWQVDTAA